MRIVAVWLVVLAACREAGTISVTLPDLGSCDGTPIATSFVVVFAEPTDCDACLAGACFGQNEDGQVIECGEPCTVEDLHGQVLHLDPGHWAVVVEALDADKRILATACADVDVEGDGTSDVAVDDLALACVPETTP